MSMLADRKPKQKWRLHGNTKNLNWRKDPNNFGQKLMQRMGWTEGKGLGREENGCAEPIKVSYKHDTKGMGFKDSVEWSVQQENFSVLLEELSNSKDHTENKVQVAKSLEEKSQNSRARVHYRKFTRGKDLSRYSEKDLANILGKKKLKKETVVKEEVEIEVQEEDSKNPGVMLIHGGSMVDYFKNKKFGFGNSNGFNKSSSDSEGECATYGFGFNNTNVMSNFNAEKSDSDETNTTKKNKKSKNKSKNEEEFKGSFVSYVNTEDIEENSTVRKKKLKISQEGTPKKRKGDASEILSEETETPSKKLKFEEKSVETPKKSKKSKKKNKIEEASSTLGVSNPAFEPLNKNITIKKQILDTITENDAENDSETTASEENSKTKKKKSKSKVEPEQSDVNLRENLFEIAVKPKQKKKKQKLFNDSSSFAVDNPSFAVNDDLEHSNASKGLESNLNDYEVKRKKKKSKGLDNPTLNLNDSSCLGEPQNENKTLQCSDSTDALEQDKTNDYEVKRKKKKKSKGLDNPALNLSNSSAQSQNNESLENGIENSTVEILDCDIMLNITDEPLKIVATPKTQKNRSQNKSKSVRFSKTNQEYVISHRTSEDLHKRNELYEINTKVIKDGLRNLKKDETTTTGLVNEAFDIESVDKIDFCDDGSPKKSLKIGIDNQGFDAKAQNVEETVNSLTKSIDQYQAEVENDINESKDNKVMNEEFMIGELNNSDGENEKHKDGVMLRFKYALFNKNEPYWAKKNDAAVSWPKKSYKHLIRGDVILGFKDSNLHEIDGYGKVKPGKMN